MCFWRSHEEGQGGPVVHKRLPDVDAQSPVPRNNEPAGVTELYVRNANSGEEHIKLHNTRAWNATPGAHVIPVPIPVPPHSPASSMQSMSANMALNAGDAAALAQYTDAYDYALIKSWLETSVKLPQYSVNTYFEAFVVNGYESLESIFTNIHSKNDLQRIGVTLGGHQLKLWKDIKSGKERYREIRHQFDERRQGIQTKGGPTAVAPPPPSVTPMANNASTSSMDGNSAVPPSFPSRPYNPRDRGHGDADEVQTTSNTPYSSVTPQLPNYKTKSSSHSAHSNFSIRSSTTPFTAAMHGQSHAVAVGPVQSPLMYHDGEEKLDELKDDFMLDDVDGHDVLPLQCLSSDAEQCPHTLRLLRFMKRYEEWNQFEQFDPDLQSGDERYQFLYAKLADYHVIAAVDDWHHYHDRHNDAFSFGYVYNEIMTVLNDGQCRHSHEQENHERAKTFNDDYTKLSILDQAHLIFVHSGTARSNAPPHQARQQSHKKVAIARVPSKSAAIPNATSLDSQFSDSVFDDEDDIDVPVANTPLAGAHDDADEFEQMLIIPHKLQAIIQPAKKVEVPSMAKHRRACSKFVSHFDLSNASNAAVESAFTYEFEGNDAGDEGDEDGDEDAGSIHPYQLGKRWYYWPHYQHISGNNYICAIYDNLKQELLTNDVYQKLSEMYDWNAVCAKAKCLKQCKRARYLRATGYLVQYYYGQDAQKRPRGIEQEHIIALLFYCNYDNLQKAFGETFRIVASDRQASKSNPWHCVKQRNRRFAHWTRLLREVVELYGVAMSEFPNITFYHGLDCELVFDRINCKFCAPTSMTTSRQVAESFSNGYGLILTLKMYDSGLRYFDCSWISNYPTEEEKLFIGGFESIRLFNIIHSRLGHNYKHYIVAIGIIQNMFDARHNPSNKKKIDKRTKNAVKNLLKFKVALFDEPPEQLLRGNDSKRHSQPTSSVAQPQVERVRSNPLTENAGIANEVVLQRDPQYQLKRGGSYSHRNVLARASKPVSYKMPDYVEQLFTFFCNNWTKTIRVDVAKFCDKRQYLPFREEVMDKTDKMAIRDRLHLFRFDVICKVFEKITCIEIVNGFRFTTYSLNHMQQLLDSNEHVFANLGEIRIQNCHQNDKQVESMVNKMVEMQCNPMRAGKMTPSGGMTPMTPMTPAGAGTPGKIKSCWQIRFGYLDEIRVEDKEQKQNQGIIKQSKWLFFLKD